MRIGTLAERTGTNVPTIRYYESIGLLPPAARQEGRQRVYGEGDVERLTFIRRCREFGFSVDQVRSLAALGQDRSRSCLELRHVAAAHLSDVRARIRELEGLARSLEASENNRRARVYTLTAEGRRRLGAERQSWEQFALSMRRILHAE